MLSSSTALLPQTLHLWYPGALDHRIEGPGHGHPPRRRQTSDGEGQVSRGSTEGSRSGDRDGSPSPRVITSAWFFLRTKVAGSVVYLAAIYLFHLCKAKPPLPLAPPSAVRLAVEVALGLFLYDLFFTPVHWAMHNGPTWLKSIHVVHHEAKGTLSAGATVRHSLADGSLQVLVNIAVQFMSPWGAKHALSRFVHNLAVTWLLCESHSGYDLPFMSHRLFPGVIGGAPRHNDHHNRGNVFYQQFFVYLDDTVLAPRLNAAQ